ncbi:ABC transporter permease [Methanofollis aquaemaris]|uniref:ABC transporter permease n=1 Tax=Methanofollis aquaemaris TaxID=126734 RepID=UPI00223EFF68|nr:ABC transporter permease [Methanofollis aquaemaris]
MRTQSIKTIAGKEFRDHIRSKRFHILFGILLVIALTGLVTGMVQYQKDLNDYNQAHADVSEEEIQVGATDTTPSPLTAFNQMGSLIGTLGAVLGIAMGFDLVTKEKESKSLKLLLSHPVYRDEVINGKTLGGAAAIALAMAIVLILSLAVLLIAGVVPSFEESVHILLFSGLSFLMIFSFFVLALFFSTVAPNNGSALVSAFIVFITLSSLTSLIISTPALNLLIGDYPTGPPRSDSMLSPEEQIEKDRLWEEYRTQKIAHEQKRQAVKDTLSLFSPDKNYQKLTGAVTAPHVSEDNHRTLADLFGMLAGHIVVFFVFPAAFFGLAWVRFAREDIR